MKHLRISFDLRDFEDAGLAEFILLGGEVEVSEVSSSSIEAPWFLLDEVEDPTRPRSQSVRKWFINAPQEADIRNISETRVINC